MMKSRILPALLALAGLLMIPACDSMVRDDLDSLQKQIDELRLKVEHLNQSIIDFQLIVDKVQEGGYITKKEAIVKDGVEGYRLHFNDGSTLEILNGKDGEKGETGDTGRVPIVSARPGDDGRWYWTVDGEWLTDPFGNRFPVSGVDGKTPQMKIEEDYWYVSYDNGATWEKLGKATGEKGEDGKPGEPGSDGDAFFKNVTQDGDYVYLTLRDGTVFSVPCQKTFSISLSPSSLSVTSAGSYSVAYSITSEVAVWDISVLTQDGYTAYRLAKDGKSGTIYITAPDNPVSSRILIFCNDGKGHSYLSTITCTCR